jgi:hypothetical protein
VWSLAGRNHGIAGVVISWFAVCVLGFVVGSCSRVGKGERERREGRDPLNLELLGLGVSAGQQQYQDVSGLTSSV